MTLDEKISVTKSIKEELKEKRKALKIAVDAKDEIKQEELNREIRLLKADLAVFNSDFETDRQAMSNDVKMEEGISSLKSEAINIKSEKDKYRGILANPKSSEEMKNQAEDNLLKLKGSEGKLKAQIYSEALKASGLDYSRGERYPEQAMTKYTGEINKLQKEIELEKKRVEEYTKRRQSEFELTRAKYEQRLADGKMTQAEFDKMIENSNESFNSDVDRMNKPLKSVEKELDSKIKARDGITEKAKIYNQYAAIYKEAFGEELDSFSRSRNKAIKSSLKEVSETDIPGRNSGIDEPTTPEVPGTGKTIQSIENKEDFDSLYKKIKNGKITEDEKLSLYETVKDKSSYDRLGMTTGIIYNKSKKILKAEALDIQKEMREYIKNNQKFSPGIEFATYAKNDDSIFCNNDLESFRKIKEMTAQCKVFHVEKYVTAMEEYVEAGGKLTSKQQEMYSNGLELKAKLDKLREGTRTYNEVKKDRSEIETSRSFGDRIKGWLFKDKYALPEAVEKMEATKEQEASKLYTTLRDKVESEELTQEQADEITREYDRTERGRDVSNERTDIYNTPKDDSKDEGMYP